MNAYRQRSLQGPSGTGTPTILTQPENFTNSCKPMNDPRQFALDAKLRLKQARLHKWGDTRHMEKSYRRV
ncbi:hypothetical protein M378DRAFT_173750 [Amanita muscaria Koide BX008]|uniref:Uncharacterized protein n=1 Tax=Amanita muscaria (strain Koide BX008) TaxID=946122 RepID=A0A0C2WGP5_AMAMK|nr:hypothetical protein M378DRAFT_173750 [Amanita muscaria Koide BX008]